MLEKIKQGYQQEVPLGPRIKIPAVLAFPVAQGFSSLLLESSEHIHLALHGVPGCPAGNIV
jgi:hypothetical protein